jgi:hypothetical protein
LVSEETSGSMKRIILYAALILLGFGVLGASTSLGMLAKVFLVLITVPFILLALGFMWIVVKVFIKVAYSRVRQGSG